MSEDEGCAMYSKMTGVNCGKLQVDYEVRDMRSQRDMAVLQAEIKRLNEDMEVDGLIFYTPCFGVEQVSFALSALAVTDQLGQGDTILDIPSYRRRRLPPLLLVRGYSHCPSPSH
jgi:hypothetical protein